MITTFLTTYLLFILILSLLFSLLAFKLNWLPYQAIAVFILLVIVVPLVIAYFYFLYFNSLPEIVVPSVTGLTLEAASQKLESLNLQARSAGYIYETKYQEGQVVSQRPEAGRKVKSGRLINLMLSSGKRKIAVPNLLGRSLAQAETVLAAADFSLGSLKYESNAEAPEGTILAQEPLPGELAAAGSPVDLIVTTSTEVAIEESADEMKEEVFKIW